MTINELFELKKSVFARTGRMFKEIEMPPLDREELMWDAFERTKELPAAIHVELSGEIRILGVIITASPA